MTFTHALATNNYGSSKFIVDASAANGTHTTIAAALTSSSSGDTIFIRPGTYTENLTLKAGVNICANVCDAFTPNVTIIGKATLTTAGTVTISGIRLQTNSDFALAVTGSAASIVFLKSCYVNCTNNTGISYTSSSGSSSIQIYECVLDVGTTGIAHVSSSGSGDILFENCRLTNTGNSTTSNTQSGTGIIRFINSLCNLGLTYSSSGPSSIVNTTLDNSSNNQTMLTTSGTGGMTISNSYFASGTASAISIGSGTTVGVFGVSVNSSNTNAITGAGIISYGGVIFSGSSSTVNTSSQTIESISPILTKGIGIGTTPGTTAGLTFDGSNYMNNYAVSTWTPTLTGAGTAGTTTYALQIGYYTRIGNMVFVTGLITASAATGTGNAVIGGLPFTIKNQSTYAPIGSIGLVNCGAYPAGTTYAVLSGTTNTTTANIQCNGSVVTGANLQMANVIYNLQFNLMYQI